MTGKDRTIMQYEQVKELIAIFEKTDLSDMEVCLGDAKVRLNRGSALAGQESARNVLNENTGNPAADVQPVNTVQTTSVTAGKPEILTETAEETKVIKAPIVGTFYQSAAPDEAPFVKVGDTIREGDVVCIIEAMKFMNEVNSEVSGTITEILVKDGEFVEYGQELFRIK